ncbi:MAG: TRAP transporter large permease subunit [Thermodesulfobacteriota bacterium]
MDLATVSFTLLVLLVLFMGGTVWIGISLFLVGLGGFLIFTDLPYGSILSTGLWNNTSGSAMLALPMFIWMGEILFRSDISQNLFKGLTPWMDAIPGRLLHVNVFACSLFAAVSGSSAATTATVGKITVPELDKRGYRRDMAIGSLAGAGTLGFMIPPSMMMLVYGIIGDVSIGKLFIAGFIPGLLIAGLFSAYIVIRCMIDPSIAPTQAEGYSWKQRMAAISQIAPVAAMVIGVLGSLYKGWATPTEAGVVGVAASLLFSVATNSMSWDTFRATLLGTVKTTCMIMLIVVGASYLSVVVGYLGITRKLTLFVTSLGLSKYTLIFILSLLYIVLGCLVDGFSMIVMTTPIVLPMVTAVGFDPIWFGIYLIIMIELAQVTPPVGFNLFVISGLNNDDVLVIAKAAMPFFLLMCMATVLITIFPKIVLFLPAMMVK